jgi:hypothetical protein
VVDIAPAVVDGVEVWRVVRTLGVEGGGTPRSEAAHLARADLRLLDRTEHLWRYRQFGFVTLHQQLTGGGNDLAVRLSFEEGFGRRITRELPSEGRPYLTDALSPVLLMAVPLRLGWAGSVSMLRWGIEDDDVASRVALRVSGEESVTVPAGTFDCWRLTVVVDGRALVHWVRKSDGLAVKVSEPGREVVLTSAANH